jgi:putative hemolysin
MGEHLLIWVAFAFCLVLSFVLSGMEAGVFALSRLRVRQQMHAGRNSAKALHQYLEQPENFLWTILVGNTLANFLIFGWLMMVLYRALSGHPGCFVVLYLLAVLLVFAFFDFLPKMLFRMFPNRLCLLLARPFGLVHWVLRPLVGLVEWVSDLLLRWRGGKVFTGHLFGNREELRLLMQESSQGLSSEERTMINRVLDLQSLTVRRAMVPLSETVAVKSETPVSEVLALARERKLTRFPVFSARDGQTRVIGLLNLNTLLFQPEPDPARPVGDYVKPALYLEEDLRLEIALRRMQRAGQRLAIVLGRDSREVGILSLQDVLKVIFGEVSL